MDMFRNKSWTSALVLISSVFILGSASADNPLCSRKIEGITVKTNMNTARAIWQAKGFHELAPAIAATRRGGSFKNKAIAFANYNTKMNPKNIPNGSFQVSFQDDGNTITLTKTHKGRFTNIANARVAEFCPIGNPIRTPTLMCSGMRNGKQIALRMSIKLTPKGNTAGKCSYDFSGMGVEIIRVIRQAIKPRPTASGTKGR